MLERLLAGRSPPQNLGDGHALRIGIVLHDFALGGTERIAVRLANQWTDDGALVSVFAGSDRGELLPLLSPGVRLVLPQKPVMRGPRSVIALGAAAASHFGCEPVDVCFVPGNYHWPVAAALARIEHAARPLIAAQVSAALHKPQRGPVRQMFYDARMRRLLAGTDIVVAMCRAAADEADTILGRADCVAIPLPALGDANPPIAPKADCRTILAVGRLVPEKGFDTLIDAFASVASSDQAASLVILGEGPEREALQTRIKSHRMETRISMPGYTADARAWLDRARLLVLSSHYEGYGAVVIEALAAGRQVISTDCTPAVHELLSNPEAGCAVPIRDAKALARAIATMLSCPASDPDQLAGMVQHHRIDDAGRRYVDAFRLRLADRDVRREPTISTTGRPN